MGIFAIRPEGNNVTNRIVGSDGVRNARNDVPHVRFVKSVDATPMFFPGRSDRVSPVL